MSLRTVQHACKDGRVPGAKKVNKEWLVPIIALTASITEADRKAAIQAGMNGFAGKPLDIRQIIEIVNKLSWGHS